MNSDDVHDIIDENLDLRRENALLHTEIERLEGLLADAEATILEVRQWLVDRIKGSLDLPPPMLPRITDDPDDLEMVPGYAGILYIPPEIRREWLGTAEWRGPAADYWANSSEINHQIAQEAAKLFRDAEMSRKSSKTPDNRPERALNVLEVNASERFPNPFTEAAGEVDPDDPHG